MTQELLAAMLGVRRESVTEAAGKLQQCRTDPLPPRPHCSSRSPPTDAHACECYRVVKREGDRLLFQENTIGHAGVHRPALRYRQRWPRRRAPRSTLARHVRRSSPRRSEATVDNERAPQGTTPHRQHRLVTRCGIGCRRWHRLDREPGARCRRIGCDPRERDGRGNCRTGRRRHVDGSRRVRVRALAGRIPNRRR